MSAEVFLLFALVVIYWVISLPGDAGRTRAMRRRQHYSVHRTTRIGDFQSRLTEQKRWP
jgi:hypothetical protein